MSMKAWLGIWLPLTPSHSHKCLSNGMHTKRKQLTFPWLLKSGISISWKTWYSSWPARSHKEIFWFASQEGHWSLFLMFFYSICLGHWSKNWKVYAIQSLPSMEETSLIHNQLQKLFSLISPMLFCLHYNIWFSSTFHCLQIQPHFPFQEINRW